MKKYPEICSQCGQTWDQRACGPSHAIIWFEIQRNNFVSLTPLERNNEMHTWGTILKLKENLTPTDMRKLLEDKLQDVTVVDVWYVPKVESANDSD